MKNSASETDIRYLDEEKLLRIKRNDEAYFKSRKNRINV
jgi:hypothetical protein